MKINYILSDTTKGATTNALKQVVKIAEKDFYQNNIVIVPETKSIIIEKELLSLSKTGVFFNVFVYSFVRLLDRMGNIPYDKVLSKQSLVILLRKIIIDNYSKLSCYKKTAKTIGFAEKIYDTIAQFKSSGVSVDDLRLSLATKSEALKEKLTDIIMLYEEYEKTLKDGFLDDCDRLALTSSFAKNSDFLKDSNVFVVGFDNITFEMQSVLRDLAIHAKEITFSSVYFNESKNNKHIQNNDLYRKFKYIADSVKYPYIPRFFYSKKYGDFKVIKDNLFSSTKTKFASQGNVKIYPAKTDKMELDFVANTILYEVNKGKRFKDFGVYVTSLEEKENLIKDCFDAYKIPYFINSAKNIDDHFFVRFISLSFELYITNLQTEKVLDFVSNPIFDATNYEIFQSYVQEMGTSYDDFLEDIKTSYIERFISSLKGHSSSDEIEENEELKLEIFNRENVINDLIQTFSEFKKFYISFYKKMKQAKTAREYSGIIRELILEFDSENKLEKMSKIQIKNGKVSESEITKIIIKKTEVFISQIENFLGDTEMNESEFLSIFKSGFSSIKVNLSPVSIDCVIVQDNTDGFCGINEMFIIGATEGKFPSKIQDSGIILDYELEESTNQIGKVIEPTVKDINKREKFRIYEALLEPTEKLYISYSEKQNSGKINTPSQVVTDLISMFGDDIVVSDYERLDFVNYDIFESIFAKMVNKFQNDEASLKNVNYLKNVLGEHISTPLKKHLDTICFCNEKFEIDGISELYFYNDKTSTSQMQTYFDCPYKFFIKYGLKLRENKVSKISLIDVGTIIHRVVELFIKKLKYYESLTESELDESILILLNKSLEENGYLAEKNLSLIQFIQKECQRLCRYILFEQSVSSFKFDRAEYSFSKENAIKLKSKLKDNLVLTGKIDRIDKFGSYIRIIDYKTGGIDNDLKSIYYGTKIQLAIYLEAVSSITDFKVAGLLYFPIHSSYASDEDGSNSLYKMSGFLLDDVDVIKYMDSQLSEENLKSNLIPTSIRFDKDGNMVFDNRLKNRFSDEEFSDLKMYVNSLSSGAVDEILSGYIEPAPIASSSSDIPMSCEYCPIYGFCGLDKSKFKFGRKYNSSVDISSFKKEEDDNE